MVINIRGDTDYDFSRSPNLFSSILLEANKLFSGNAGKIMFWVLFSFFNNYFAVCG